MERFMLGVSTASCGRADRDVFYEYKNAGIGAMEISLSPEKTAELDPDGIRRWSLETGVEVWSFHLPFYPFETNNIASPDREVRKNSVLIQTECIKKAAMAGAKIAVIHPSAEPNPENERAERLNCAKESLALLSAVAAKNGMILAVEDLPRTCLGNSAEEIKDLISADERLMVCFDTNHLLIGDNVEFVRALGEKIVTVHISDYDFSDERHWLPFEGKNDWDKIIGALCDVGYSGPFMYEVSLSDDPEDRKRPHIFSDYLTNYKKCTDRIKTELR